jgi:hypothetical protein
MNDYEKFLEKQNDEIIENLCKDDIEFWKKTLEKEPEEEPTVIIDEIYLITMQSQITSLREKLDLTKYALDRIVNDPRIDSVEKCMIVARDALDKIGEV